MDSPGPKSSSLRATAPSHRNPAAPRPSPLLVPALLAIAALSLPASLLPRCTLSGATRQVHQSQLRLIMLVQVGIRELAIVGKKNSAIAPQPSTPDSAGTNSPRPKWAP